MRAVSMRPLLQSPHRHHWRQQTIRHLIDIGDRRRARRLARRDNGRSQPRTPPASPALRPVSSASSNGDEDSAGDDSDGESDDGDGDSQGPALRASDAARYCGFSRTTLWRLRDADEFPDPFRLTANCVAWRRAVLDRWLDERQANGPASTKATRGERLMGEGPPLEHEGGAK